MASLCDARLSKETTSAYRQSGATRSVRKTVWQIRIAVAFPSIRGTPKAISFPASS